MGNGTLGIPEKQAIALRVAQVIQEMGLLHRSEVRMDEWVHYMLIMHHGFAAGQINSLLHMALRRDARTLHELQELFERTDKTSANPVSVEEVVMKLAKLVHLRPGGIMTATLPSDLDAEQGAAPEDPYCLAREVLQAMDLKGDEHMTYPEFMAYCLGRTRHEVTLHLYDLSAGAAEAAAPWLLGRKLEGIWHTGVVVFDKEYYYAKDTVFDQPGQTSFGVPTRVVHLGHTLWRQDELHEYVVRELKPIFHRDTYDVVTNNCNHFADRLSMYLVGQHVPEEVLSQPFLLLESKFVRVLRPVLNWYLRDRVVAREKGKDLPSGLPRLKPGDRPPPGTVVILHPTDNTVHSSPIVGRVKCIDTDSSGCKNWLHLLDSCAMHTRGVCGAESKLQGNFVGADNLWIQYIEYRPAPPPGTCRAQVRTELVPCSQLSIAAEFDPISEAVYLRAMKAMGVHGAVPFAPTPSGGNYAPTSGVCAFSPETVWRATTDNRESTPCVPRLLRSMDTGSHDHAPPAFHASSHRVHVPLTPSADAEIVPKVFDRNAEEPIPHNWPGTLGTQRDEPSSRGPALVFRA